MYRTKPIFLVVTVPWSGISPDEQRAMVFSQGTEFQPEQGIGKSAMTSKWGKLNRFSSIFDLTVALLRLSLQSD
jgi:hypothetical protein